MQFKKSVKRAVIANAIDDYIGNTIGSGHSRSAWESLFEVIPAQLLSDEREAWKEGLKGVVLSSDAFFPFSDNIERAVQVCFINIKNHLVEKHQSFYHDILYFRVELNI